MFVPFRKQKAGAVGRDIRPMRQEEAIQFMAAVIRPRATFTAEQFYLEHADARPGDDSLATAVVATRATVAEFTLEWCNMSRLSVQDRTKVIARLQSVGVDAFLERFAELNRLKARGETSTIALLWK